MFRPTLAWCTRNPILLLGSAILLIATLFIGYKNGKIDMLYSDAIVDHNLLQLPIQRDDINIQAIHTHFFKWPLIILENIIGLTARTHVIFSFLLLFATNSWLGYLFYKFSEKNTFITGICLLLLASMEILMGISAQSGTMTMITIRNIEIPIVIALLYAIVRSSQSLSSKKMIYIFALSLLFASDFLLLYTAILGFPIFFIINQYHHKKRAVDLLTVKDSGIYLSIASAAIGAKIIHLLVNASGLANFYEMKGSNDRLSFIGSFKEMFLYTLDYIDEIMRVFGANFFGANILSGWMYVINFIFFLTAIYLVCWLVRSYTRDPSPNNEAKTLIVLLSAHLLAMLAFTVLIPRELAGRYFAFLPVICLLIFAYRFKGYQISANTKRNTLLLIPASILVILFFGALLWSTNDLLYRNKYSSYSTRLGDTSHIVNILNKEDVSAFITIDYYERGFWSNHVIKQQYDQKTKRHLSIVSVFCGGNVVDRQFSKRSWATPDDSRIALRITACDTDGVRDIFGQPEKVYPLHENDIIYIYDQDIRSKLNLGQYDENRFYKI